MFAVSIAGLSLSASAGFDEGSAAFTRGDYVTALNEWRPLAENGNARAQFNLGLMYVDGLGVPQDYAEAARLFRMAAMQGDTNAQLNLGVLYAKGQGVPQDYSEAVSWYRKAAEQGDVYAQFILGRMYVLGRGVPQNYVEAHMWWNLAASQGNDDALMFRDKVAEMMTPAQIAEAQKLAQEWQPK
jgi:hypothetical protein